MARANGGRSRIWRCEAGHIFGAFDEENGVDKEVVILVATSGDTGKAALEGFKDVDGTSIICFYPDGGVSEVQELQMLTTGGSNTYTFAVKGTTIASARSREAFANEAPAAEVQELYVKGQKSAVFFL